MSKIDKVKIYFQQLGLFQALGASFLRGINKIFNHYAKEIYSQHGEDMVIETLLQKKRGFYVDIGCHHPKSMSNTYRLYKKGWRGVNVDANPDLIKKFKRARPQDICVCEAISDQQQELTFYEFDSAAVSTLDEVQVEGWKKKWRVVNERKVLTKTLTDILDEQQIKEKIDFLSIDVEGHDFQVLKSLDFTKYRPYVIVIEMHEFDITQPTNSKIYNFLLEKGYQLVAYAVLNGYFLDKQKN